ncbi:hypothetical protein E2C01_082014 [Portunus trituberculatus]|uniref:Uncharacterized protein n=1 Tax=Portunus trituberculatus TaxID=210409 RepID=A0A5B7ITD7_PORTR|nr:hypothetical protein [Portunus trituberculatus]
MESACICWVRILTTFRRFVFTACNRIYWFMPLLFKGDFQDSSVYPLPAYQSIILPNEAARYDITTDSHRTSTTTTLPDTQIHQHHYTTPSQT